MKRSILPLLAALFVLLALGVDPAAAQFAYPFQPPRYGPGYQTQLSPYLNMLRGGDPAANYYIGVVPEFQRREDRNRIYNSLQTMPNRLPAPPGITEEIDFDTPLPPTGHPTALGYTGSYLGGMNQSSRTPTNPFMPRQPSNAPQPPGKAPVKPR